jgi:hypothetical protein
MRPELRARTLLYAAEESRHDGGEWSQAGYVMKLDILLKNLDWSPLKEDLRSLRDEVARPENQQINYVAFENMYNKFVPTARRAA